MKFLKKQTGHSNGNRDSAYQVPDNRELIAQEVLLFEIDNKDDLLDVIDADARKARLTLKLEHRDSVEYQTLIRKLEDRLENLFPAGSSVTITGNAVLSAESVPRALKTMSKSYIVAAILIIIMMILVVQSPKIGLISIVPNLLPIVFVLNVMVIMDWPLDMATIMFGAIALGIVVDDTLHFLYHFKLYHEQHNDAFLAVHKTLRNTGPALFITTIIFSTGAASNMLSSLDNIFAFGLTMWMATILALIADLIIAPALLITFYGHKTQEVPQTPATAAKLDITNPAIKLPNAN